MTTLKDGVIKRGQSWSFVVRVTDASGISKPRWVGGFPSEAAAKEARDNARIAARRGQYIDRNRITVESYLTQWLSAHALEVKPRTRASYSWLITSYVVPRIGRQRLQAVRPGTLSGLYRDLLVDGGRGGRGLSARTVEYVHAVLRKAFNDAVHTEQLLSTNPAERAKRPRREPKSANDVWSAEQLSRFLAGCATHRLFAFYRLAAYSGARRGELLNLRWADVYLDGHPSFRIRGSAGIVDGRRVEGSTKSGKERVVSIDSGTAAVMRAHAERQAVDRATAIGSWVEGDYVFRMEIGAPLYPDTPSQLMPKLIRAYNEAHSSQPLPHIRLHDLRHVHATLLLKAGAPVHVVAARLGHADPSITLRVYAHVLGDQASEVAQVFADAMSQVVESAGEDVAEGSERDAS